MNDRILRVKSKLIERGYLDNEWLDKYVSMLEENLSTIKSCKSTQLHHAIPINSYWVSDEPYNRREALKLSRSDPDNFEVSLLYKDHLLIHSYLTLCTNLDEVQRRYEAQADIRKNNSVIGSSVSASRAKRKKAKRPTQAINTIYHENAKKKRELKQKIDKAHELYREILTRYGKDSSLAIEARQIWKQAISDHKNFCNKN